MADAPDSFPLIFANGGLPAVPIETPYAAAMLYLHGAHVTHFQPAGHKPVLFLSGLSQFAAGKPIRGGVPVIFPWFGPHASRPDLPMHGLARSRPWQLEMAVMNPDRSATFTLTLSSDDSTRELFPHEFVLRYRVHIAADLTLSLTVQNTSEAPFAFEEALHTYLNASDVRGISIAGLKKTSFIDKTDQMKRKTQRNPIIRIGGETDRIYVNTESAITIEDPGWRRIIRIEKSNSLATIVWNPHIDKARAMADFGDDEWKEMICVETANAADHAIHLAPGTSHTMTVRIHCMTSG
jgi:D-hexose-6-phosphate mutarotase